MLFSTLLGLAASISSVQAVSQGFNYGATHTDGSAMVESDFEGLFKRAQDLQGTSGFTSARLYTMIQGGTTDTPSEAIQAAINTKTTLLLGLWCSAGQTTVTNEINALTSAIQQYGSDFTNLIVGISVGSEDLYRVSPTGIENNSGAGATPDELVSYINQTRSAIQGTGASAASIGHVDTWTAWVNGSNDAVINAIDWLGMDTYPYFETTLDNPIGQAKSLFFDAYDKSKSSGNGKEVWITETGWPVSGKTAGQAVPSTQNAETYWQEVACQVLGTYNTWWYTLQDASPTTPNPSFGIVGSNLNSAPLYDLSCKNTTGSSSSSAGSSTKTSAGSHATGKISGGSGSSPVSTSALTKVITSGGSTLTTTIGSTTLYASETGAPYPGGNGNGTATASGSAAAGSASGSATTAGATSSVSGAPTQTAAPSTGGAAKNSALGAGILAILGLVAAI